MTARDRDRRSEPCAGQAALVTGSSRGIGAVIAERLAVVGATVAVTARTLEPRTSNDGSLLGMVDRIRASGGLGGPMQAGLARPEDRPRLVEAAQTEVHDLIDGLQVEHVSYMAEAAFAPVQPGALNSDRLAGLQPGRSRRGRSHATPTTRKGSQW